MNVVPLVLVRHGLVVAAVISHSADFGPDDTVMVEGRTLSPEDLDCTQVYELRFWPSREVFADRVGILEFGSKRVLPGNAHYCEGVHFIGMVPRRAGGRK